MPHLTVGCCTNGAQLTAVVRVNCGSQTHPVSYCLRKLYLLWRLLQCVKVLASQSLSSRVCLHIVAWKVFTSGLAAPFCHWSFAAPTNSHNYWWANTTVGRLPQLLNIGPWDSFVLGIECTTHTILYDNICSKDQQLHQCFIISQVRGLCVVYLVIAGGHWS